MFIVLLLCVPEEQGANGKDPVRAGGAFAIFAFADA
jgi:hypothetical protein